MHLSNLCLQNMLWEMCETLNRFCIEVRLSSMMRVPSPLALRFGTLCASVRLGRFKLSLEQSTQQL